MSHDIYKKSDAELTLREAMQSRLIPGFLCPNGLWRRMPVLNAPTLDAKTERLFNSLELQTARVEEVSFQDYNLVEELRGNNILVRGRVVHEIDSEDGRLPGEFNGKFIGEALYSTYHPIVLLEAEQVIEQSKQEDMRELINRMQQERK